MKSLIVFQWMLLLTTALAVLFTSCSNETEVVLPLPDGGGEGYITFTLPSTSKVVTYGTTVAHQSENAIANLTVYMFNDNNKLENIYRNVALTAGSGGGQVVKIDVTGKTGKKFFYFAANAVGRSTDLENLNVGVTTKDELLEAITLQQTDTLSTPLLMSATTTVTDITKPDNTPAEVQVKLLRRVARMDILNNDTTNFDIKKVLISNASQRAYVFEGGGKTSPLKTIEKGKHEIVITPKDPQAPVASDSIFYLYPGTMGTGAGNIAISFEGVFNKTQTKLYNINTTATIEANKRYILRVKKVNVNDIEATLEVAEWENGTVIPNLVPEDELVTFGSINLAESDVEGITADASNANTYDITNVTKAGTVSFTTTSYNAAGTKAEVTYTNGDETFLPELKVKNLTPDVVRTYAASYTQTYEIEVPVQTDPKVTMEMQVTIINEANKDQKQVFTFFSSDGIPRYPGTNLFAIKVDNTLWAPVNVGATKIGTEQTEEYMGKYFQWGRNVGFAYKGTVETQAGPVSQLVADGSSKFITSSSDWLSSRNDGLWSNANKQGPCPNGWHVATKTEFKKLVDTSSEKKGWDSSNNRCWVKSDDDKNYLYLPAAGRRASGDGGVGAQGSLGRYWSSEPDDDTKVSCLYLDSSTFALGNYYSAAGYSVRCVKE